MPVKPDIARRADEDGAVRVEYQVRFSPGQGRKPRARVAPVEDKPTVAAGPQPAPQPTPKPSHAADVPKITRLLVLGHYFERLVRDGVVQDYAEIARLTGLTRARVTQIVNLTMLASAIQEHILHAGLTQGRPPCLTERALRLAIAHVNWRQQHDSLSIAVLPVPTGG